MRAARELHPINAWKIESGDIKQLPGFDSPPPSGQSEDDYSARAEDDLIFARKNTRASVLG